MVVLAWPPDSGRSLGAKLVNWAADPRHQLPELPDALPMALDDDGDAVTEHDMAEAAYNHARDRSVITRWRLDLKAAEDPFSPSTQRQLLVALSVLGALVAWRMDASRTR